MISRLLLCLVPCYCQVRQALLELLHTRIRDLGAGQIQSPQSGQALETDQTYVCDLGAGQIQPPPSSWSL